MNHHCDPDDGKTAFSVAKITNGSFCFLQFECYEENESLLLLKETINKTVHQGKTSFRNILKADLFVSSEAYLDAIQSQWEALFEGYFPPTSILIQPPMGGVLLSGLVWIYTGSDGRVCYPENNTALLQHDGLEMILTGAGKDIHHGWLDEKLRHAYDTYEKKLHRHGFAFSDTVRAWICMEAINGTSDGMENYQRVNKARFEFFQKTAFGRENSTRRPPAPYPASTGIGCLNPGIIYSAIAVKNKKQRCIIPFENDRQVSAFDYPKNISKYPPCFSRSMSLVVNSGEMLVFISGTASIVGAKTVFVDSVKQQTHQTLDNVENLLNRSFFNQQGIRVDKSGLDLVTCGIIYIKQEKDYEAVKKICEARLPSAAPRVYVRADVCRKALLVEIEVLCHVETNSMPSQKNSLIDKDKHREGGVPE